MDEMETKAWAVANNPTLLRFELNQAKSCLARWIKPFFRAAKFDFNNKRLMGDGYALQWKLRRFPNCPESYENQQTSRGIIIVVSLPEQG